ncbi:MAG: NHLP bacteriocin system secretion protein [Chlorobium sp.]|jgi:HlyD family secretion protein|nr:NHLP bacteriocin system secretion protein [Chlorobium sp.]
MALEFRKEALKKLSSPDDLDRLMPVTDARGWIALLAGGILLLSVVVWGFMGKIPVTVPGEGITMVTGSIDAIYLRTNGVLKQFTVKGGDVVQKGQVIGVVEQPELREAVETARSETEFLSQHQKERQAFLQKTIASLSERVDRLNALFKEGLVEKALVTSGSQDLMTAKNELYALEEKSAATDRHFDATQYNYKWQTVLVAPYMGKVTEVQYNNGDFVSAGRYLLLLEETDEKGNSPSGLLLYMYVSAGNAKQAKKGMTVFVSPSTVAPEEYGHIIGDVISVSDYPETTASIENDINESLAQKFTAGGPVYKVVVKLRRDASTYSGYRWTSGKGPHVKVTSGTICTGRINIEDHRPIDLVIPVFKKYVLGESR